MKIEIYAGEGEEIYIRLPGSAGALRWTCTDGSWISEKGKLPTGVAAMEFGDLPDELREEILAFVARAEAMGNQIWSVQN